MATVKKDGGPAFPKLPDEIRNGSSGMNLRDWFAGKALSQCQNSRPFKVSIDRTFGAARDGSPDYIRQRGNWAEKVAGDAYAIADAMLAERSK
jgi:hypothetical protein